MSNTRSMTWGAMPMPLLARVHDRPADGQGFVDDLGKSNSLFAQPELAGADARDIEQIVDQPGHVTELTIDDVEQAGRRGSIGCVREQVHRGPDRRARGAQLVTGA